MLRQFAVVALAAFLTPERTQANDRADLQFKPIDGTGAADVGAVADGALTIPLKKLTHVAGDPGVLETDFNAHSSALYNPGFFETHS
jgi:hypothetical protein